MKYVINPSEDGIYIILKVWGESKHETIMQQIVESHELGEKLGIDRHLVDLRETWNADSVSTTYKFAYEDVPRHPKINPKARVALLVSPDDHTHDFSETVSRNAGYNVTLFRDWEAAINHLLK